MGCLINYRYCDASGYKSYGAVWLSGRIRKRERDEIFAKLESQQFFIAEQLTIPPLYEPLYRWSGARPTSADHCWHELLSIEHSKARPTEAIGLGTADNFVKRIRELSSWQECLSPHFN